MSDTDLQLLARYTRDRAEDAFAELVRRHLDLVHSAALRQVRSPQLAEEVAQSVFTDLARNAHRLTCGGDAPSPKGGSDAPSLGSLTAWLYQVTRRTAIDVVRREARRQLREQIAAEMNAMNATNLSRRNPMESDWTHIEPLLDEAMSALDETDRAAVLLRYFENKSLREVGATFGTSDDAAQKRVSRAVERLREFLAKRGVTVGASGLAVFISANAVQAAPVGLAVTISSGAAALAGTVATATIAAQTTMNWINIKSVTAIVAAVLVTGTGMFHVQQREANRLRAENQNLVAAQAKLSDERNAALSAVTGKNDELERLLMDKSDLLRLRSEVGILRRQSNDLETLRKENAQLRERSRLDAASTQGTNKLAVVSKIVVTRVKQPQVIGEEQIRTNIQVKVGEAYDRAAIDRDVQSLYGSGLLYRVLVQENKTAEGVILNYLLQEKPKLIQIQFTGDTRFGSAALIPNLASKVGERLDEQVLARDAQILQKLYRESGFPGTRASYVTQVNEDLGEGDVTFEIIE